MKMEHSLNLNIREAVEYLKFYRSFLSFLVKCSSLYILEMNNVSIPMYAYYSYTFYVEAENDIGEMIMSNVEECVTPPTLPPNPTDVCVENGGPEMLVITWTVCL